MAAAVDTTVRYRIHGNPQFRATVTNWGYFGTFDFALVDSASGDPTSAPSPAPAFESPPHSRVEYLYDAGLWIGGLVDGDTLVSTGTVGWSQAHELFPSTAMAPLYSDSLGDEEFTATYADTLTDPLRVPKDEYDGTHRPLPVTIRQTTRLVSDSAFSYGLIVEITAVNIGRSPITGLWLGWMVDPDIGYTETPLAYLDDLTGYRSTSIVIDGRAVNVHAAWAADNDGDPVSSSSGFDEHSATRVFASMYLGGTPPLPHESYNWWIAAVPRAYDWGPQHIPGDTNADGGRGRPLGDAMKYRYMADRGIDYDQMFAAVDQSANGWVPPPAAAIAGDYADGYDTRFLHTVGPVTLQPGDSVTTAWAWVVAPQWHTDPRHFQSTFDPLHPEGYRAGLNMAALDTVLARMQILWNEGFAPSTIGPPRDFSIAGWDDSTAHLRWLPRHTQRLSSYSILRSLDSSHFGDPPITSVGARDSVFTNTDLERLTNYYYTIQSVDQRGHAGSHSSPVTVLPDRPLSPAGVSARRGNREITLTWASPGEPDIAGHRVYRLETTAAWRLIGETADPASFVDRTVDNAVVYWYHLAAVSALGSESFPTAPTRGIAFAFDGPPLVIDQTLSGSAGLTDKDSVQSVWQRLLASLGTQYRDADPARTPAFGLDIFDPHPVVTVVTDGRFGLRNETLAQLELYTYAGGVAILSGRDLFNAAPITEGAAAFGPGSFPYDALGITAAYYPRVLLSHPTRLNAEFIGAHAVDPRFADLSVDSARADWGLNPALPSTEGAAGFVGYFEIDTARATVLYTFESREGPSSALHGKPAAVMSKDPRRCAAAFAFPLSYICESQAQETLLATLSALGWETHRAGDANGDDAVTVADVQFLLRYLFRNVPLRRAANADANADCRVDLLDAVVLVNYVWRGGAAPVMGCTDISR